MNSQRTKSGRTGFCKATTLLSGFAFTVLAVVGSVSARAAPPLNNSPPNEPKAIVEAVIGRDFKGGGRYTGGQELFEYYPVFESYPAYEIEVLKEKDSSGKFLTREAQPTFGKCAQQMIVKEIKVSNVQYAQAPTSPVNQPINNSFEVYVTVEAEVVALRLNNLDAIPVDKRCSWLGLEVKNTQTGKLESYFDNVDDDKALLKMMKQFGTVQGKYVVIDAHRRHWSYGINLLLPRSGKGQKRHYDMANRKYVDAVQPRWLIQDPYPPEGVYLGAAIADILPRFEVALSLAQRSCMNVIQKSTGKITRSPDFELPVCKTDKSVQSYLETMRHEDDRLEVLRKIK